MKILVMPAKQTLRTHYAILFLLAVLLSGCVSIGPGTIPRDRFDYAKSIRTSWKEQMLLNMVGLRYGEAPVFLEVSSVISQYSLETGANASGAVSSGSDVISLGGSARWSDRPTITYSPMSGQEFTRELLTPLKPRAVFGLVQAGWPIDRVVRLSIWSINGITSREPGSPVLNPDFFEVIQAFDYLQKTGGLIVRRRNTKDGISTYLRLDRSEMDDNTQDALNLLEERLGLAPGLNEYQVVVGRKNEDPRQISIQGLSILEILMELSQFFEVPPEHISEGRTTPTLQPAPNDPNRSPPLVVNYSIESPESPFVAIQDRGYWYYIDDRDIESKNMLSLLTVLLSLAESSGTAQTPAITIGAGG